MPSDLLLLLLLLLLFSLLATATPLAAAAAAAPACNVSISTATSVTLCTPYTNVGTLAGWLVSGNRNSQAQLSIMPVANHSVCWLQIAYKAVGSVPANNVGNCLEWEGGQTAPRCAVSWRSPCIPVPAGDNCTAELTGDGDLVLHATGGGARWDSGTAGKGGTAVTLDDGGGLDVVDSKNNTVWSTSSVDSKQVPGSLSDCVGTSFAPPLQRSPAAALLLLAVFAAAFLV